MVLFVLFLFAITTAMVIRSKKKLPIGRKNSAQATLSAIDYGSIITIEEF
jgi:hypothetical protein